MFCALVVACYFRRNDKLNVASICQVSFALTIGLQKFVCSKDRLPNPLECEDFFDSNKSAPRISKVSQVVQANNLIRHQEIYLKGGFKSLLLLFHL